MITSDNLIKSEIDFAVNFNGNVVPIGRFIFISRTSVNYFLVGKMVVCNFLFKATFTIFMEPVFHMRIGLK